ncbi:hypothetical protein HY213_02765 [Candidatus Peregrinibacteria bacterium]|nr:hypothetical protein [Candidatus Peregrinibacteria bacterium]
MDERFDQLDERFGQMETRIDGSEQHLLSMFEQQGKRIDETAENILLAMEQQWHDQNDVLNDKFSLMSDRMIRVEEAVGLRAA